MLSDHKPVCAELSVKVCCLVSQYPIAFDIAFDIDIDIDIDIGIDIDLGTDVDGDFILVCCCC